MLIIYCICLFDGCFGSGVWQCWNCRVPFFCWDGEGRQREVASVRGVDAGGGVFAVLWGGWRGTPEEGGIGPGGCGRGTPEEGGIAPGRDSVGGYY